MKVPVLVFDNIMLRDISLSDAKDMLEYGSDMEVLKWLAWGPYRHIIEAKQAIKNVFLVRPNQGLPVGYAIIDLTKNKMIGTVDFHTKRVKNDKVSAEIGYAMHKDYWGQGIMTKCVKRLIEIGFNVLKLDVIACGHAIGNLASEKVIKKCGFSLAEIKPKGYFDARTNTYFDVALYKINKEQYYDQK